MKLSCEQFERILRALQGPPTNHERRRAERFLVGATVQFLRPPDPNPEAPPQMWQTGLSMDISEMGLDLVTTNPAERGQRISVSLPDGAGGSLTISCSVAYSRLVGEGMFILGLEFVEVLEATAPVKTAATPAKAALPRRNSQCCGGTHAPR